MALRATKSHENPADHKKRWSAPRDVFDGAPVCSLLHEMQRRITPRLSKMDHTTGRDVMIITFCWFFLLLP